MKKLYTLFVIQVFLVSFLTAQVPTITSFSPKKGNPGTLVTLTGTNFNTTAANNTVYFGATRAIVMSSTANTISVFVPPGATYKPITVFNAVTRLSASSKNFFVPTFSPKKNTVAAGDFLGKVDFPVTAATKPNSLTVCDLFLDGKSEILYTADVPNNGFTGQGNNLIFNNFSIPGTIDSTSFVSSNTYKAGTRPQAIAYGDINQDGSLDFASAVYGSNQIYCQGGSGSLSDARSLGSGFGPIDVAICDIDLDGKPDVISANALGLGISVFRNTNVSSGVSSFSAAVDFIAGFQPIGLAVGDIDGDGKEDVAVALTNSDSTAGLALLRNTSTPGVLSFATAVTFTTGPTPRGIALVDVDGNDKLDVVIANQKGNTISILRNTATPGVINAGSLASKVDFTTGNKPKSIAAGDLNGDGKPDIVVTNTKANNVSVFQNLSAVGVINASSLAAPFTLTTGAVPVAVAIADVDGDGKPDIETANYNANTISVIKNEPTGIGAPKGNLVAQSMEDRFAELLQSNRNKLNNLNANVYPNPARDVATLSFVRQSEPVAIKLTDSKGNTLWQKQNVHDNILQIQVSNLPAGMYFISINNYMNDVTLKMVKQ